MCGIAGLIARERAAPDAIRAATDALRHRGPDDEGLWQSEDGRVSLGHRRLSIIDLSAAGHQPMESADGRFVLVYNGEIYNHASLRAELEAAGRAPAWRGHSDTETLLAAIVAWGVEATLTRTAGMFAIALWDRRERRLTLARDRLGEKPLYYGWTAAGFAFASELSAIRALPGFDNGVSPEAVRLLLGYGCVPAPWTIHQRLFKLPPGTILTVPLDIAEAASEAPLSEAPPRGVTITRFYDYAGVVLAGAADAFTDPGEARAAVREALEAAVARQLVADVPVGAFLSGGIDSSLVTAFAARATPRVKTFSIGFGEPGYDEAPFARAVAAHLGTDHYELYVTAAEAQALVPQLATLYDEPFADDSALPTFLVSRFARSEVTVALSGDGGDELFGGYNRHRAFPKLWRRAGRLPAPLRRATLGSAAMLPAAWWGRVGRGSQGHVGHKIRRLLAVTGGAADLAALSTGFLDQWHGEAPAMAAYEQRQAAIYARLAGLPFEAQVMAADALAYLPDMILPKVDRAGMAVSLEGRIPFLDPAVAAAAARVPVSMKFGARGGKAILRDLLDEMVPPAIMDRPKAGFTPPLGAWLRGPLREWAEALLAPEALARSGLVEAAPVRRAWAEHLAGRRDATEQLWAVLMLQGWLAAQR